MATPDLIDIEALTAPISEDNPVGPDPRDDPAPTSLYQQIKIARDAARNAERMALGDDEADSTLAPEWRTIAALAPRLLAEESKDLEVAIFLLEALVRESGFAGARDGLRVIRELVDRYHETMHPVEEYTGKTTDIELLNNLNGLLPQPIQRLPITEGASIEPFATWQYQQANQVALVADADKRQARIDAGAATFEKIAEAVKETPPSFFVELKDDVGGAFEAYRALDSTLDEKFGDEAPALSKVRETLQLVSDAIAHITQDVVFPETADPVAAGPEAADGTVDEGAGPGAAGAAPVRGRGVDTIETREDAFRMLLKVADFFRRMEPHSTVSYTLEELVRRGRLPLQDLLAELIPDTDARDAFLTRAGIVPPPRDDGY